MSSTFDVTIYGASDDLVEFDSPNKQIYGEATLGSGDESTVVLTSPDGQTLSLTLGFCTFATEWGIRIIGDAHTPSWPIRFTQRPDRDDDPAVVITVPSGTVATVVRD